MESQDYYITKGSMILTKEGHMTVNSHESGIVCLTVFGSDFREVGTVQLSLEEVSRVLSKRFGREFNVIWLDQFTRV